MNSNKKRIDSSYVSDKLWKAANTTHTDRRNVNLNNICNIKSSNPSVHNNDVTKNPAMSIASLSEKSDFTFSLLNIQPPSNAPIIIRKQDVLISRGPAKLLPQSSQLSAQNLNVEIPIISDLYKFKKRIVSSKQIEKKIENNEYLMMILNRKKKGENEASLPNESNAKNRLRSALPRHPNTSYHFQQPDTNCHLSELYAKDDKARNIGKNFPVPRNMSAKPVFTCKVEIRNIPEKSGQSNQNIDNRSLKHDGTPTNNEENYKIRVKFDPKSSTISQHKFSVKQTETRNNISGKDLNISSRTCLAINNPDLRAKTKTSIVKRPTTSAVNYSYNPNYLLNSSSQANKSQLTRPLSSITPMFEVRNIFSAVSHTPSEDPTISTVQNLHPIFDFNENTIFVSLLFKDQTDYIRPSDRIGHFMQATQSFRTEHIAYISTLKRGTHFDCKALHQIPMQLSIIQIFNENRQTRDKGICYYIDFQKMLDITSYSIFPEFVSTEIIIREGIESPKAGLMEENERRFLNRDAYFLHILNKMKGTYDPAILINDYYTKRYQESKGMTEADIARHQIAHENSMERYSLYCAEQYIPKSKIPPFDKKWVMLILRNFPEKMLKDKEVKFRHFFKEIFDDYVLTQRKCILGYLLRSNRERKRLGINHLPEDSEITSNEIITRAGGYHKKLFTSWNDTFVNCGKILNKEEKLLNIKTLAFKNWLSEFQNITLFEEQMLLKAHERDILANIHGFVKFQIAYLGMFEIFGENFLKRGIVTLIDGNFYLKPSHFGKHGQFQLFQFTSLTDKKASCSSHNGAFGDNCIEEVLAIYMIKDSANLVDMYSRFWKKLKPLLALSFFTKSSENDKCLALDFLGKPCDPKNAFKSHNPYERDPYTERLIRVICLILQDFIVEQTVSSLERFYQLIKSKTNSTKSTDIESTNQPLITLELRFDDGVFCFDDNWDSIKMLVNLYFEKLFSAFDFIYDLFDYTIVVGEFETDKKKPKPKKRPISSDGVKTDLADFLKDVNSVYSNYMPEISLEMKSKDEEDIVYESKDIPHDMRSQYLNKDKILQRLEHETNDLRHKILHLLEDQYKEALKVVKDFSKFQPVLSRSFENNEFPEFMRNQKSHVLAFSSLVMQKNKNTHAAEMTHVTDKLKNEELLALKNKLIALISQVGSIQPTRFLPLFRIRCSAVISSIQTYLREIDERLCKRVVERVILNVKAFLARYQRLTDILRKEIATSTDYAWLRGFSVEVGQERQILLKRTREIFENFDFYLKMKSAKVNGTEVLELLLELSNADKALEEEIENSLERGYMRKVEFECLLKDEKMMFQAECAELLEEVQILRTINDIRNSAQYYEEVEHLYIKLEKLKVDFKSIDLKEKDIYERNYKTTLFVELDDLLLTNLEVWKKVSQSLAFIKKTNLVHVCQMKIEPIEEFLVEYEQQYAAMISKPEIWSKENLRVILSDFKTEVDELASHIEIMKLICIKELKPVHWKDYFESLVTDLDFQFLNLKIFLSLYNEENKGEFEELCQRAIIEDGIQMSLDISIQSFEQIKLRVADTDSEIYIENYEEVLNSLGELRDKHSELENNPETDFAQDAILALSNKINRISKFLPLIRKMQEKLEYFKETFNRVEYSTDIEKEHKAYLQALGFNRQLKDLLTNGGIKVLDDDPEFESNVRVNISRLEIIENHQNPSIFSAIAY